MMLSSRLSKLERASADTAVEATIIASSEDDARDQLERVMLQGGGPTSVTLEVAGMPPERFMINDKPHEYWVERMEAMQ
jgi:hypothetical protein